MYAAAFFETDPRKVVEAGPALDPRGERLRAGHPRRARLARRRTRTTGRRPGSSSRRSGTRTTPARTARSCPSTSTRGSTAPTSCSGLLYGDGDFAKTLEVSTRAGPGLRLQPVERRRHPRRDARLRAHPRGVEGRHPGASPTRSSTYTQYSFNEIVASHAGPRRRRSSSRAGGTGDGQPRSSIPRAGAQGARRSSSGTPDPPRRAGSSATSRPGPGRGAGRARR